MLNSFTVLSVFALGEFARASGCLCTYGNPCWPDAATFAQLESQVSQPLIYPIPTASACYPAADPSGNCSEVIQNWTDGNWRSSIPGSMQAPNFETFVFKNGTISACYLNTSLGVACEQGNVPVIGVDARTPNDIQAAVNFAIQYNLKLVVKNTGLVKISSAPDYRNLYECFRHDLLGRSAARGAFVVWTHNMKNITYNTTFTPQGGPLNETYEGSVFSFHWATMVAQPAIFAAVTLAAGVQWHEAYDAVNQYGRMMVGGIALGGSIGAAGGWLQGGGHSILSPTYGLGMVISTVLFHAHKDTLIQGSIMQSRSQWSLLLGNTSRSTTISALTCFGRSAVVGAAPMVSSHLSLTALMSHFLSLPMSSRRTQQTRQP